MDALNQFPGVFILGENGAMMGHVWNLYTTYDRFSAHYMDDSVEAEMAKYERFVHRGAKPAWYNEFNHDKIRCLPYDIFRTLYGYSGFQEYIVGFKETRFWEVDRLLKPRELGDWAEYRCDNLDPDKYEDFVRNLMFHESLCENTKFIFNHRRTYDDTKGTGFYVGPGRGKVLKMRLEWAETFASEHPNNKMTVYYEDMFDPSINGTVMSQIARFLGRKMPTGITFARLPKDRVVSVAKQGSLSVRKATTSSELRAASYVRAYSFGTYPSDRSEYARRSHIQLTADGAWEQMESQLEKEGLVFFPMIAVNETFNDAENLIAQGVHVNIPTESGMEYVLGTLDVTVGVKLPAEELVGTHPKESVVAARERAYLSNICVLSSARRQGIAQSLIESACLEAYDLGVRHMYVHVVDENSAAIRLYEDKCGFKIEKAEHAAMARALNRPRRLILHKML